MIGLAVIALLAQAPLQPGAGTIEGMVVKAGTGEALSRATVEVRGDGGRAAAILTTITEADGRFFFRSVRPGHYGVLVHRPGYVRRTLSVTVAAGQPSPPLQAALTATGAIFGRVSGRNGEPIGNAEVEALKATYRNGIRTLNAVQAVHSDDRGEYRLFWLPPGRYYVRATHRDGVQKFGLPSRFVGGWVTGTMGGPNGTFSVRGVGGDPALADALGPTGGEPSDDADQYVPVYYPTSFDEQAALPIEIRPGTEQGGIDLSVTPVRARHVRGVVINGATGQVAQYAGLTEVAADPPLMRPGGPRGVGLFPPDNRPDGTFDLTLLPGRHILKGTAGSGVGYATIDVGDTDIDGITIVATPTFNVPARLSVEGASPSAEDLEKIRFTLVRDVTLTAPNSSYSVALPDGSITLSATPGDYWLSASPLLNLASGPAFLLARPRSLENAYVKSARLGSVDVLNGGLRLEGPPPVPMEIVIGMNPGGVEGSVNSGAQAAAGLTVVLVPDVRRRFDLFRTGSPDPAGRFRIDRVPAGDYKLFAWEESSEGAWEDPEFIRAFETRGTPLRVVDGRTEAVSLTAIPAQ